LVSYFMQVSILLKHPNKRSVMTGLVPAIHAFLRSQARRGCPAQGRA